MAYAKTPLIDRVADKFLVGDDCWEWTASTYSNGYGWVWDGEKGAIAHRVMYELLVGPIPKGLTIDHLCRNRLCVRPDHLEPVTSGENTARSPASPSAINKRKTHCKNGHEFVPGNILWFTTRSGNPGRICRACHSVRMKKDYQARKNRATA